MTVTQIIAILERRIANLSQLKTSAEQLGDLERAEQMATEIETTETTLSQLRPL
jgi:hypothetical protein